MVPRTEPSCRDGGDGPAGWEPPPHDGLETEGQPSPRPQQFAPRAPHVLVQSSMDPRNVADFQIEPEYVDAYGTRRLVSPETITKLAAALVRRGSSMRETLVWRQGDPAPLDADAVAALHKRSASKENAYGEAPAPPPGTVPAGIFPLARSNATPRTLDLEQALNVIVAPATAYHPDTAAGSRCWLLAVQLYGVASDRNWGHGDFTDLKHLLAIAAECGAAGIGLNPLHALFDDRPEEASPYSPNSRLFLNPLYIDIEAIPEFPGFGELDLGEEIARLRLTAEVDYSAVAAAKMKALRATFACFLANEDSFRKADFEAFRRERDADLSLFAAFETLRRRFPEPWWNWPDEFRSAAPELIQAVSRQQPFETRFCEFVQWTADRQLRECRNYAQQLGLPIGLYVDIAVGVEPAGADAWSQQSSVIQGVEIGAPPDLLNTAGQAWGLAAFNPNALEAEAFFSFRRLLVSAMQYAGAIRLDHVLGLNRLYLIPSGCKPHEGAYVRYPLRALLAVIAIESVRHRCVVIGEDLGTVPDDLRNILADWGIWSYRVMLFERGEGGRFLQPEEYPRNALATFSTHDLPTFAGWKNGHDLRVKHALGIDPGETADQRSRAVWLAGDALAEAGLCKDDDWDFVHIAHFLARTPSRILAIGIEDILGIIEQPNVPGTTREHPNWRRRLSVSLEQWKREPRLRAIAAALAQERSILPVGAGVT
jgi:4-alpha-glucanotransferase